MKKKTIFSIGILATVVMVLMGGVYAYGSMGRWMDRGCGYGSDGGRAFGPALFRTANPLNFTDEQWGKIDEIGKGFLEKRGAVGGSMFGLHGGVRSLIFDGEKFDEAKARKTLSDVRPEFVEMAEDGLRAAGEIYAVLDDEQRARVDDILSLMEERAGQRMMELPRRRSWRMMEALDLTREQREKADSLFVASTPKMQEHMKALFDLLKTEQIALRNGVLTEDRIKVSAEKIADLATEGAMSMGRIHGEFQELLTPEQRGKMERLHRGPWR